MLYVWGGRGNNISFFMYLQLVGVDKMLQMGGGVM